ncbi:unnamed protein product, partial [Ectocarpus sp. 4 AP-2014]
VKPPTFHSVRNASASFHTNTNHPCFFGSRVCMPVRVVFISGFVCPSLPPSAPRCPPHHSSTAPHSSPALSLARESRIYSRLKHPRIPVLHGTYMQSSWTPS